MKKIALLALVLVCNIAFAQDLLILHTNDMHAQLNGIAPATEYTPLVNDNDPTQGGFARIAGFIKSEKEKYGDKVLVVDAGDFLMGTLFQTLEPEPGFQLTLMKKMGYEFVAIGNHEFDFGANKLAQIISNNQKQGEIPQLLCANYLPATDGRDVELVKKFKDGSILPYKVITKNGHKIGVFAVLGRDADESIASYNDVSFDKITKVGKATAAYLKNTEKVELVVVLSHSGVTKTKKGIWEGEDYALGKAVPEIDVIISGHTHTYLSEAVKAGNAIVVQTGALGNNVGRIAVTFNANKKPAYDYHLIAMDDKIMGDKATQQLIDEKSQFIDQNLLSPLGIDSQKPVTETHFGLTIDYMNPEKSNLGPFISDAVYYMLNKKYAENVDVTIVASGVIRHDIVVGNKGLQNINDLFNVMPLGLTEEKIPGSPLGKIYITGHELKKVLELILTVYHKKLDYYLYTTGMQVKYNPGKGLFHKISEITIGDAEKGYRKVSFAKSDKTLYSIAANKYILSFIGALKKMSFGIVNVVGKNADGSVIKNDNFLIDIDKQKNGTQEAKEWLALLEYVRSFKDENGNGVPDIPAVYKTKLNGLQVVK